MEYEYNVLDCVVHVVARMENTMPEFERALMHVADTIQSRLNLRRKGGGTLVGSGD